ncbi:MAG: LPS-assembly protein LptD [Rhodothermaceae bacterium]|nr:LPS-assembly protein LptD [Rhodothermaceae bacterium]
MSPRLAFSLVLMAALVVSVPVGRAQDVSADTTRADSLAAGAPRADSLAAPRDTVIARSPPSIVPAPPAEGGLEQPVTYTARDSLRIVFGERDSPETDAPDDRAYLFGDVSARYAEAELTAGRLELLFGSRELRALTVESDTGQTQVPSFSEGSERFTGRELVYNLETQRGRVVGARTQIQDGFLLGGVIKQAAPDVIYAANAAYTTCELDHPHYALEAGRMKIVGDRYVYTGPVQLKLLGIPTPLWLPFGFFPATEGRRSGPLPIRYGEDRSAFGFFLDNLGWYWAINDHLDALVSTKVGTRGSFQVRSRFNYVRRYAYDGALDLSYTRLRSGEALDPDFSVENAYRVGWRHAQQFGPNTRLSADVDLASSARRFLTEDLDERVAQTSTSRITLAQNWARVGRSLQLNLSATQRLNEGEADLTLPSLSFSQQRRFPFRRARSGRPEAWYEKISVSYSGSLTNTYRFDPLADTTLAGTPFEGVSWIDGLFSESDWRGATGDSLVASRYRVQAQHQVPIGASYNVTRFLGTPIRFNLAPSIRYTESWTDRFQERTLNAEGQIVSGEVAGFTAIRRVSLGVSANTEFYGIFPVRVGPLDGFRHVVRPQLSFAFEPDYSAAPFNYYRSVADTNGVETTYPIASGLPSTPGRTQRLGLSLGNVFQTRVVRTDSTGEEESRTIQLATLNLRSAYDFAAEERPLGDVALDLTSQFNRFRVRLDASFSPYALDTLGRPSPRTYFAETGRLLRTTRLTLSAGTSFRGGGGSPSLTSPSTPDPPTGTDPALPNYGGVTNRPVDFRSPWSLALDFTYGYTPLFGQDAQERAVLSVSSFDFSLTPNWKIAGRTGYDLIENEVATTQLSILRDLHCWEMRFNWIPFGDFRSFSFSINVKSGYLRDLLRLDFPRSDVRTQVGNLF